MNFKLMQAMLCWFTAFECALAVEYTKERVYIQLHFLHNFSGILIFCCLYGENHTLQVENQCL